MPEIEIFRTGTHTAMSGETLSFGGSDLAATVGAYDAAVHEAPACVGHPAHDAPAYGWVRGLRTDGAALYADLDQVDPEFAEMVKAGRFKKISAAFYPPNSAANPRPGVFYLRHVGFLGAQPPAVKGLKPVQFAGAAEDALVFGAAGGRMQAFLRWLSDNFKDDDGRSVEPAGAQAPYPSGLAAKPPGAQAPYPSGLAAKPPAAPAVSKPSPSFSEDQMSEEIEARERALKEREAAVAAQEAAFAEQRRDTLRAENGRRLDDLVAGGSLLPAERPAVAAFLESLSDGSVAFGEGASRVTTASRELVFDLLKGRRCSIPFGEFAPAEDVQRPAPAPLAAQAGYVVDAAGEELRKKALAYMEGHKGVDFVTAYKTVGGR
jgi:hypothetical protein